MVSIPPFWPNAISVLRRSPTMIIRFLSRLYLPRTGTGQRNSYLAKPRGQLTL